MEEKSAKTENSGKPEKSGKSEKAEKAEKAEKLGRVENIHENHRERVRRAYVERGDLSGMHEHQILELLLFYAIKRRDVNPLAHRLIARFGSLKSVLRASIGELQSAGLSESTAVLLKLVGDIGYAIDRRDADERIITNTLDAFNVCFSLLFREKSEAVALLCLDGRHRVIRVCMKTDGMADKVNALPKWIVDAALSNDAPAVILAHNHPSGSIMPSAKDNETTTLLDGLLAPLGITLYDHIIVTRDSCYSMRRCFEKNMLEPEPEAEAEAEAEFCGGADEDCGEAAGGFSGAFEDAM